MIEIRDRIERRPIEALIPYARNSRTHSDEQIARGAGAQTREIALGRAVGAYATVRTGVLAC